MSDLTNPPAAIGFLTKAQVAERLQKSQRTVERWCKDGVLPHIKIGAGRSAAMLFDWEDIKRRLKERYGVNLA